MLALEAVVVMCLTVRCCGPEHCEEKDDKQDNHHGKQGGSICCAQNNLLASHRHLTGHDELVDIDCAASRKQTEDDRHE